MSKRKEFLDSYLEEFRKLREGKKSTFSTREELDSFFKERIEKEGGLEALLGEKMISVIEKLEEFRKENSLEPGEILGAVKYIRLYTLTKI